MEQVLLEKLVVPERNEVFFTLYGTQRLSLHSQDTPPLFVPIPNHINPVLALPACLLNIRLNIILLWSFKWSLH